MTQEPQPITTDVAVILPEEVQSIALSVSEEKRAEVNNTLTQIFAGTADWKAQVDAIVVTGPDDKLGMKLANTARLNAKNARLAAEKIFDKKRDEVQAQMLSYQTEDKLWLKAKQTMIILFKEIEQAAEYKEKTAERYEKEQYELKIQQRLTKLASVDPLIGRQEIEGMSDVSFDAFLAGLIAQKEAAEKEAARQAEELRQAALKKERDDARFRQFAGLGLMFSGGQFACAKGSFDLPELCELSDKDFAAKVQDAMKMVAECKAEEIAEKEKLAIFAAAKQKEAEAAEAARKKAEADAADQKAKADAALKLEQEKAAAEKAKQDAIIAKQKAELEARRKQEAEAKAAEAKRIAEEKAAAELAAKAPKKEKLTKWVDSLEMNAPAGLESDAVVMDVLAKFAGFKKWAKGQVEKI
jgi:colicin import membrane protein